MGRRAFLASDRRRATAGLVGLALLAAGLAAAEAAFAADLLERNWRAHSSVNFRLVSDLDDEDAAEHVRDLEMFRSVVLRITGRRQPAAGDQVEVVLISRPRDFSRLFGTEIYGFFATNLRGSRMVAGPGGLGAGKRQVLFHEYVHHLLSGQSSMRYPPWYNEGLAEMLSTIHEKSGRVVVGGVPKRAQREPFVRMPITTLLNDSYESMSPVLASDFYYGSWVLVHYLHFGHLAGEPNRFDQMLGYLSTMQRGMSSEAAFASAFDITPLQLQAELQRYLERNRLPKIDYPRDNFQWEEQVTVAALSREQVAYELGYVAMYQNPARALELFDSALQTLPADAPLRARTLAAVALAHRYASSFAEGYAAGQRAVEQGPSDPLAKLELADLVVVWCNSENPPPDCDVRLDESEALYVAALALSPGNTEISYGLARLHIERGKDVTRAFGVLAQIANANSWSPNINFDAGRAAIAAGRPDLAAEFLRRAFHFTHNEALRSKAAALLEGLSVPTEGTVDSGSQGPESAAAP